MVQQHHFLLVTYAGQGHINPCRHLAFLLTQTTGARVTITTSISGHRRMFPSSTGNPNISEQVEQKEENGQGAIVYYVPHSDGTEDGGLDPVIHTAQVRQRIVESLTEATVNLANHGHPVTFIIYALFLTAAADVARDLAIPSVLFWIQPAALFAIYYHYFHGYSSLISSHEDEPLFSVELPGLPSFQIRDLPSFLTTPTSSDSLLFKLCKDVYRILDREVSATGCKPKVLVNTFHELEADALGSIANHFDMYTIGPLVPSSFTDSGVDLFEQDSNPYIEWLDSRKERSVVYVSFGSMCILSKVQLKEISKCLEENGRPYLWVVRKDMRDEGDKDVNTLEGDEQRGMVVQWCNQARVLSHRSIGCFVTHCGWNSTLETMLCGVPTVMLPQWSDEATNARLAEGVWGTGVRAEMNGGGVVEGRELSRCLNLVMADGEKGMQIRRMVELWKEKGWEAVGEEGLSVRNLRAFVERISFESVTDSII